MGTPFELEYTIWQDIMSGNIDNLDEYLNVDSIVVIDGELYKGTQVLSFLKSLEIKIFEINNMRVTISSPDYIQTLYDLRLTHKRESKCENLDSYFISMTWNVNHMDQPVLVSSVLGSVSK